MQYFTQKNINDLEKYLQVKQQESIYEKNLWTIVKKYSSFFSHIPGISCVCICNSLAMKSCHKNSDIDLFVITKRNRLWTARIFLTLFLSILGKRKNSQNHAGKFCLSFFISEEDFSLKNIALENDIYLAYWIETLIPLVNTYQSYESFMQSNKWYEIENQKKITSHIEYVSMKGSIIGDTIESIFKKLFLGKAKKSFQKLGKPFGVIISDTMLKFHNEDQRKIISQKIFQ